VLKRALEDKIATLNRVVSWTDIIADLDALTETEIEQDGKRFIVRSAPRPAASLGIRATGVALPPTVRPAIAIDQIKLGKCSATPAAWRKLSLPIKRFTKSTGQTRLRRTH